jgi:hypothetical protein
MAIIYLGNGLMKNFKIIAAGVIAAAMSLTAVTSAQAYPAGQKVQVVLTGGIEVNGKTPTAKVATRVGAQLVVKVNGTQVAAGTATSDSFVIPTAFTKSGKYTILVTDQDSSATSYVYVPGIKVPAKGKIAKAGTIALTTVTPKTIIKIMINGKVVVKSAKIAASGSYSFKLVKKNLKKGKNKVVITIGKTKVTKTITIS